jgi:hypothetical protein
MQIGGADVQIRRLALVVQRARRAVRVALVLALVAGVSVASAAAASPSRPSQVRPKDRFRPRIVGKASVGVALRATRGTWTLPRPVVYEYSWLRCRPGRVKCRRIAGAKRPRYSPSSRDVGMTLRVTVTAWNAAGSGRATSRPTRVVLRRLVQPTPPADTSPPTVSGTAQDGQTLTATTGSWTGTTPIAYVYQWQSCDSTGNCNPISGATTMTYAPTATDVGSTLKVTVTASNMAGTAAASSAPTAVVQPASGPPPGLVALWHMDETSGTTMFDSVGGHNGTLNSVQLGLPGFSGTAYGFNGSSSYVAVPSTADLNPGSANIIFTIHVQTTGTPPATPADWDLLRKGIYTTGGAQYKIELVHSGQASCGFEGTNDYAEVVAGPAINDGHWHTVSCIKTSTAIEVVVDGQVFSKAANVGSIANTTDVIIGAHSTAGPDWFQGQLDEASIQIG